MANNNPLLKYVMKTQTPEVLHSSGYAKTQNADSFGAASTETFSERRRIEEQRKFVRGYRNSLLAAGTSGIPRAKTYIPPAKSISTPAGKPTLGPKSAPIPIRKPL
ncbi:MAG: hypothetical protein LBT19_00450 [Candidatus Nomurabacteria bacterium]|jgi:hypothetical protein|nr:hypothetical protein [Candidatus Nomurabacteria bacterium]